jgi:multidrug transporter EmrE-like cation transporter
MRIETVAAIGGFLGLQVVTQLLFKWGSLAPSRWGWGLVAGNVVAIASTWLLMMVYKSMNPNVALGICGGGAFLLTQVAMAAIFKSDLSITQWTGVAAIFVGMILLAVGK